MKSSLLAVILIYFSLPWSMAIPVILWNIKGNSLNVLSTSVFKEQNQVYENRLKRVLQDDVKLVVFVVKQLSLENLSIDEKLSPNNTLQILKLLLGHQKFMLLSHVTNPADFIKNLNCGVKELSFKETAHKESRKLFSSSCAVVIHLADFLNLELNVSSSVEKDFLPPLNSFQLAVGIFTGLNSSWVNSEEDHYVRRKLLESADSSKTTDFVNINSCMLFFTHDSAVIFAGGSETTLPFPASTKGSQCDAKDATLILTYKASSDIVVKMKFASRRGSWTTKVTLTTSNLTNAQLESDVITAPVGSSFGCQQLLLYNSNRSSILMFQNFKVQPFGVNNGTFGPVEDCVPFLTGAMWMGLVTTVVFVTFVYYGVLGLFFIGEHYAPRFEDKDNRMGSIYTLLD